MWKRVAPACSALCRVVHPQCVDSLAAPLLRATQCLRATLSPGQVPRFIATVAMAPVDGRIVTDTSRGGFKFACAQQKGRVEVIVGPMFSGKSSELFRRVRRHSYAKHSCLVLTHTADTRYNEEVPTFVVVRHPQL